MASMIDGESYLGRVMIRRLSQAGEVTLYLWPLRCLRSKMGGPTFGIDVKGEEILRFDPHGSRGHWHKGGYDRLGAGGSHQDFPEGIVESEAQLTWALAHLEKEAPSLLEEAGYSEAAAAIDAEMFQTAIHDLVAHLEQEGDLRSVAIERELINA